MISMNTSVYRVKIAFLEQSTNSGIDGLSVIDGNKRHGYLLDDTSAHQLHSFYSL